MSLIGSLLVGEAACSTLHLRWGEALLHHPATAAGRTKICPAAPADQQGLLFVNRLFSKTLFLRPLVAGSGGGACDEVNQSHSSNVSHNPEPCESQRFNWSVSYQDCKMFLMSPCQCTRQKSLCKHYLLSAQYKFSIGNKLSLSCVFVLNSKAGMSFTKVGGQLPTQSGTETHPFVHPSIHPSTNPTFTIQALQMN